MRPFVRATVAVAVAATALVACVQIIGLDDTKDRAPLLDAAVEASTDSGDPPCEDNGECIDRTLTKAPALCVQKRCVRINTDLCLPDILPDPALLRSKNLLLLAGFIPRQSLPKDEPAALAFDLALQEFNAVGGIKTDPRRDVAMVLCANDKGLADQSIDHVVHELQVPAVIAGFASADLSRLFRDVTSKAGVFLLNPSVAPNDLRYDLTGKDFFWSLLGSTDDVALAYRPLVAQMSAFVQRERGKDGGATDAGGDDAGDAEANDTGAPEGGADAGADATADGGRPKVKLKVALLQTETSSDVGAASVARFGALVDGGSKPDVNYAIQVNDLAPDDDKEHFRVISFKGADIEPSDSYSGVTAALVQFEPDIVIALTQQEADIIIPAVDRDLEAKGLSLPIWLLGQRNARGTGLLNYLTDATTLPMEGESTAAARLPKRLKRFVGVQFAGALDPSERDAWLARMNDVWKPDSGKILVDYSAAENFYDAVYWVGYAFYAGNIRRKGLTDSQAISTGMSFLLSGPPIYTGSPGPNLRTGGIEQAFNTLLTSGTGSATFVGALGPPDIDERYKIWRSVGGTYCYPVPAGATVTPRYDVQRYNRATGKLDTMYEADRITKKTCNIY